MTVDGWWGSVTSMLSGQPNTLNSTDWNGMDPSQLKPKRCVTRVSPCPPSKRLSVPRLLDVVRVLLSRSWQFAGLPCFKRNCRSNLLPMPQLHHQWYCANCLTFVPLSKRQEIWADPSAILSFISMNWLPLNWNASVVPCISTEHRNFHET